jgi:hypothetical protein
MFKQQWNWSLSAFKSSALIKSQRKTAPGKVPVQGWLKQKAPLLTKTGLLLKK